MSLLALLSAEARAQKKRLPIIDMHMHARTTHHSEVFIVPRGNVGETARRLVPPDNF